MIALLSPAKSLDTRPAPLKTPPRAPAFVDDSRELLSLAKSLSTADLSSLMGISDALATLNHERFQSMSFPLNDSTSFPAATLFDGDVYKGMDARTLDADAMAWADDNIRILSGLYGLLRPLDLTHPYRLEMGTKLKNARGANLYAFWGDRLAKALDADLQGHSDPVIVDLASKEYNRAVPKKALAAERLEVQFKEVRDGKPRIISFFAKKARGTFARWMIDERVERRGDLKAFDRDGYAFATQLSTEKTLVFTRAS